MSTWTSKGAAILAAFALTACAGGYDVARKAPERVRLPSGVVVAVMGSCAAIARNALLPKPGVPAVMTVSVDNDAWGTAPAEVLDAYFATAEGRAALARDGRASSVRILESRQADDALFLHAVDRSGFPATAAEDYWRAIFDLGGRFVTVSLVGLSDAPIPREDGLRTLQQQVNRLRAANRPSL